MEGLETYEERFRQVRENIRSAAERAGRDPEEITLLPVTKTQPVEVLEAAWQLGMRIAGENHVQEIAEKKKHFGDRIRFHMIGHLQRNKVRQVLDKVELIHSVDSLRLARDIDRIGEEMGLCPKILIEVNVAKEASKYGITVEELPETLEELSRF